MERHGALGAEHISENGLDRRRRVASQTDAQHSILDDRIVGVASQLEPPALGAADDEPYVHMRVRSTLREQGTDQGQMRAERRLDRLSG